MSKVYKTQDYLKIELIYEGDIGQYITSAVIKYMDPEGNFGQWEAVHDLSTKTIYYNVPLGQPLNVAGRWTVWSVATMNDGRVLPGDAVRFVIDMEGT